MAPSLAIGFAWLAWFASWLAAAAWTRQTVKRAASAREFPSRIIVLIGGALLFVSIGTGRSFFPEVWRATATLGWVLFVGVLAGMAFAWWARLHLGALWSGTVTRKEGHRIIDTGPYAVVRHPIYTGVLFSMWMTAIETARIEPILGCVLLSLGLWMQARLEERFLAQELGATNYEAYSARVPMLIPFLKGRGA